MRGAHNDTGEPVPAGERANGARVPPVAPRRVGTDAHAEWPPPPQPLVAPVDRLITDGRGDTTAPGCPCDGLAVAERSVAYVQAQTGLPLTAGGRARLEDTITGLVAQLLHWRAVPSGGPPDPWTCIRRRWHRHPGLRWWAEVPLTVRRMLTGAEPRGRDSLIQLALSGAVPPPALRQRWRTALLDLDPAADAAAAARLARRRASYRGAPGRAAGRAAGKAAGLRPTGR